MNKKHLLLPMVCLFAGLQAAPFVITNKTAKPVEVDVRLTGGKAARVMLVIDAGESKEFNRSSVTGIEIVEPGSTAQLERDIIDWMS